MTFRASSVVPSDAYQVVKRAAVQLKANLQGMNARLQASGADYEFLQNVYLTLTRAEGQFDALKVTPGLADYAQAQEGDPTYDVAAEFTAMQNAIDAATAWMGANIPTSVTAKAPATWDGGSVIATTFTPAQTAGLRTALQGVIDSIS